MLTIETRRYSETIKAFVEQFPSAVPTLDKKTQSGDIELWCTNAKLKAAIDFSLDINGKEILGFHDGPWNMWASDDAIPLLKTLEEKKVLRFSTARYMKKMPIQGRIFWIVLACALGTASYFLLKKMFCC